MVSALREPVLYPHSSSGTRQSTLRSHCPHLTLSIASLPLSAIISETIYCNSPPKSSNCVILRDRVRHTHRYSHTISLWEAISLMAWSLIPSISQILSALFVAHILWLCLRTKRRISKHIDNNQIPLPYNWVSNRSQQYISLENKLCDVMWAHILRLISNSCVNPSLHNFGNGKWQEGSRYRFDLRSSKTRVFIINLIIMIIKMLKVYL